MLYTSLCCLLLATTSMRADSIPQKKLILKTTVLLNDTAEFHGYLSSINDSTIIVTPGKVPAGFGDKPDRYKSFHYTELDELSFQRKGSVGRGILIGAVSGLLVGTIIGVASYKEPPPNEIVIMDFGAGLEGAAGGMIGMVSGGVIGGLIGKFASKRFVIKGKKERMRDAHDYIEAKLNRTRN